MKPSLRDLYIGLSTIMADEGILEDEIDHFHKAIKVVGKALKDIDLQALEGKTHLISANILINFIINNCFRILINVVLLFFS